MRNNHGFTLIEVIFVLGVLSILLLLSAPLKVSILDNQKEEQFLTTFQNDLLYMQSISYLSKEYIGMEIKADHYTIITDGHENNIAVRRSIPADWDFDLRTFKTGLISFNRNGTIRTPGNIHLTTNNASYKIVFPLGKGRCYIEKL